MNKPSIPLAVRVAAGVLATSAALAADEPPPGSVLITGNPLRSPAPPAAASVLAGDELVRRRGTTIAETLDGEPGLAASWFGPAASRPVIRGLDAERIRVLSGGGATFDASALSSDHALAIDPLVVERIEVLRGPAALLYGGSAIGGVVNVIDNRIPAAPLGARRGSAELRLGGAADERSAAAVLESGWRGLSLHADGFVRRFGELSVPAFEHDGQRRTRVVNSDSRAEGGALGASLAGAGGYAGLAVDTFRTRYGSVAEADVRLSMQRDRLAAAGEWRAPPGWLQTLRASASSVDYRHDEIEDGAIGTTFATRGRELRVEAVHREFALGRGRLAGVVGLQAESSTFDALGDEAFVPPTRSRHTALFTHQTWRRGGFTLEGGARAERVRVSSSGDPAQAEEPRFGPPQTRSFAPRSASLRAAWAGAGGWSAEASWSATQRAPAAQELFASGVHVATAAFERGDAGLGVERGRHHELGVGWRGAAASLKASLYASRFANYIALIDTGEVFDDEDGEHFPVLEHRGVRARFSGAEVQARGRVRRGGAEIGWSAAADSVRGDDRSSGEPLPRIAPRRVRLGLDWSRGAWQLGAVLQHTARQSRVPASDVPTDGFARLDLAASWRPGGAGGPLLFVRLDNVTDRLGFNATTLAGVRALAPLPGRSLRAGIRLSL